MFPHLPQVDNFDDFLFVYRYTVSLQKKGSTPMRNNLLFMSEFIPIYYRTITVILFHGALIIKDFFV